MKNSRIPNAILILVVIVFTSIQLCEAIVPKKLTGAVLYHNAWIPSIQLKEVEITSKALNKLRPLYRMDSRNFVPVNHINQIYSYIPGIFVVNKIPMETRSVPYSKGYRAKMVCYNQSWIPSFDLNEVTISADKNLKYTSLDTEMVSKENTGLFKASARESFDILIGYLAEKGNEIIQHLLPKDM